MYVYKATEPNLWTVGFYDPNGEWFPESDHESPDKAAERMMQLNSGITTAKNNKNNTDGSLPLSPDHICFDKGHAMYLLFDITQEVNGSKMIFGAHKCSRCGHEENFQFDILT